MLPGVGYVLFCDAYLGLLFSPAFGHKVFLLSHSATGMGKKQKYKLQSSLTSKVVLFEEM